MSQPQFDDNNIVFLVPAGNGKGKKVLKILQQDTDFLDRNDCSVVLANQDPGDFYKEDGIKSTVATNQSNPVDAIRRVSSNPDYIITCGWSTKIESETLDLPKKAALNCHSSFLPDYKGLSVYRVQWAHAEEYGGATVHHMTDNLDGGKIVCRQRFRIGLFDSPLTIMQRYTELTASLIREAILLIEAGYKGIEQDGGQYFPRISWTKTLSYGSINRIFRGIGSNKRMKVNPKK